VDDTAARHSTDGDERSSWRTDRQKLGTTVGTLWTPMAACSALVKDVSLQIVDQPEQLGTLLNAGTISCTRTLRSKCAAELRTGAIPAKSNRGGLSGAPLFFPGRLHRHGAV